MNEIQIFSVVLVSIFSTAAARAQSELQREVAMIAREAKGTVSVSCSLPGTKLNCNLNQNDHPPMQSIFKYPLALTVLHLAELGKLIPGTVGVPIEEILERKVRFLASDRIPNTFSPLQDRYPNGDVDVSLRELIVLTAGQSDNVGSEILLRIIGGPHVVQSYVESLTGPGTFQLKCGEKVMDRDPRAQYANWIEPEAAARLLQRLVHKPPLQPQTNAFLVKVMTESMVAPHRLRAGLPSGTPLAHRTGTSGFSNGQASATNDIGLITLPGSRYLSVAVFVSDAHADDRTRDSVIARIGRAAYDAALQAQ